MKQMQGEQMAPEEPKRSEYYHIFKKISWCPTNGCGGTFRYKGDRNLSCEMCKKQYCLDCRCEFHKDSASGGWNCDVYQQKLASDKRMPFQETPKFKVGDKFRVCERCKEWVKYPNEELGLGSSRFLECCSLFCYLCGQDQDHCRCD